MAESQSWQEMQAWMVQLLERSGDDLSTWKTRIAELAPADEPALRKYLDEHGVRGYAQMLLVFETFGYPDFFTASADELIDAQYADRPQLRPVLDAVLATAAGFGDVTVQARKGYVSLVTRRQFALVRATTRSRVDLGLRLEGVEPEGRWERAKSLGNDTITLRTGLTSADDVDDEVQEWLHRAYVENS